MDNGRFVSQASPSPGRQLPESLTATALKSFCSSRTIRVLFAVRTPGFAGGRVLRNGYELPLGSIAISRFAA